MRYYIQKYFPERIMWSTINPVFNDTRERDTHRYYWCAKMAKDFIMLTEKEEFTYHDINGYFTDKVFLNYLNDLVITAMKVFQSGLVESGQVR